MTYNFKEPTNRSHPIRGITKHLTISYIEGKSLSILFLILFYVQRDQHCIVYLRGMTKHLMLFCIEGKSLSSLYLILFYIQKDSHCIVYLRGMTKHLILSCIEGKSLSIPYLILFYPPTPMNHVKIVKGCPPRDAPLELVQLW